MYLKPLILLVDDNEDLLFLLRKQFELAGYEVLVCVNGKNFMKILSKHSPQVVLLDIAMGSVSGSELCQLVRLDKKMAAIKILIMSGNHDIEQVAINCGADGFIKKPLDMDDIKVKIEQVLS